MKIVGKNMRTPKMVNSNFKILVIGLGEIGYSNCEYMTKQGLHVDGFEYKLGLVDSPYMPSFML